MLELHRNQRREREVAPGTAHPEPLEPRRKSTRGHRLDLVPGVAFDLTGRAWAMAVLLRSPLCTCPRTARIAGAFDLQVVPQVPAAPHDLTVDRIVTERRDLALSGRG